MTICPICFKEIENHFVRHLTRHHSDDAQVKTLNALKPKSKDRLALVAALRKQGYFHIKTQHNVSVPVKSSKIQGTEYFACTHCLGQYSKKTLYKHVKACKKRPLDKNYDGKKCLSKSQTFTLLSHKNNVLLRSSRLRDEVFNIMRADAISEVAKTDPMICLYGESLLQKHKRKQMAVVVSNKMREMARLLIAIREIDPEIKSLFDTLKPELFHVLVSATKTISGYDESTKTFRAASLALHMGTNLKLLCNVAFKIVIEKRVIKNLTWDDRDIKKTRN